MKHDHSGLADSRIYLAAPVNALVEGIYVEHIPLSQIRKHGDFGLGTFDHLDGEMVMLDGHIFQMTSEGKVIRTEEHGYTPFACVTFFRPVTVDRLEVAVSYKEFQEWLQTLVPSDNIFYAIRVTGVFNYVKVRSVPKQECYRPLVEVAKEQPIFEFNDVTGTLAGFYTPQFMSSLNVPGLHLHFLSEDHQHGGHLLECRPQNVEAGVQWFSKLELSLPMSVDYLTYQFTRDINQDLNKAEK